MKQQFGICIMTVITVLSSIGYIPQIVKMYKTKSSTDISDSSWWIHVISSFLYFMYFLVITFDFVVLIAAGIELVLNVLIVSMSLYYKHKNE